MASATAGFPSRSELVSIGEGAEFDARDVAQPDGTAVVARLDDNVLELPLRGEAAGEGRFSCVARS